MRLVVLLLALPLLSSCKLLQTPGRTLQAVGRTFGLAENDTTQQQDPVVRTLEVATKHSD